MRYLLILLLLSLPLVAKNSVYSHEVDLSVYYRIRLDRLWNAICEVESGHDSLAYNKKERARGVAQIRPVMIREVNRLYGTTYKYRDAFSIMLSYDIFVLIQHHYNPELNFEKGARIWNGGNNGMRKKSTEIYWKKVNAALSLQRSMDEW